MDNLTVTIVPENEFRITINGVERKGFRMVDSWHEFTRYEDTNGDQVTVFNPAPEPKRFDKFDAKVATITCSLITKPTEPDKPVAPAEESKPK